MFFFSSFYPSFCVNGYHIKKKNKKLSMFQLHSKLAEYLQKGYAQERDAPFQDEKNN